jgi:hypothetical protein
MTNDELARALFLADQRVASLVDFEDDPEAVDTAIALRAEAQARGLTP